MNTHAIRVLLVGAILPALSGCGHFMDRQYVRAMGASELESKYTINGKAYSAADILAAPESPPSDAVSPSVMSAWLGAGGVDSRAKCSEFIARVSVQQTGWDTSLDVIALATGGAAAVALLPATTVAGLAAASTFATGTRALIDSDVYGKVGANLIAAEIRQDYDPAIRTYMSTINVSTKAQFADKLVTLLEAHDSCSLQAAVKKLSQKSVGAGASRSVITAAGLQDNQTYTLLGVGEIILAITGDQVTLKGYTGDPTVSRAAAAAILNGAQAVLQPN